MLLASTTAWATVKTVTYTYTDQRISQGHYYLTFTATGDINTTYEVEVTNGAQSVSFTLGDLHVNWASNETYFSCVNSGGWRIGGTAGYSDWTFTLSSDNYYIDNVKYYNKSNYLRIEQANDTKSCAITADNVAFGGSSYGIHAFTVVMSDSPAYAIHYELNGAKASSNANPSFYETATGLTLTEPTKDYYDFGGWYDNEGLSGNAVTSIPAGSTGERTLYAKWTPHTYTISYVLNDGTNPSNARTSYTIETPTFNLPEPTHEGYAFRGWYLNEEFASEQYTQIKKGTHKDYIFYAKWEEGGIEGKGTKKNPFKITNEAQLRALAAQVNGGDECEGQYFQQTCDITITGGAWTPIGSSDNRFRGNYDGGNYTISGININSTSINQGLFGSVSGLSSNAHCGFIQNVILENSTIVGKSSTGGIVGFLTLGHVQNCHVRSSVTVQAGVDGTSTIKNSRFGGVVGDANKSTITDCTSMASVNSCGHSNVSFFGGVIGYNGASNAVNCYSYGKIPIGRRNDDGTVTNVARVYKITCTDGSITLPEEVGKTDGFYYDGIGYYKEDATVPLAVTLDEPAEGYVIKVSYNDGSDHEITPNADGEYFLTTPASDVTVKAAIVPNSLHFSQLGDTYTINSTAGWNVFCDALQDNDTWNRFIGKIVKLGDDITVTRMAGSDYHDFCGTFDGDAHTITLGGNTTNGCYALFRNAVGATIQNLHVDGTISTAGAYAAGLISGMWGDVTINNCRVSINILSSKNGDCTHGGFVAKNNSGKLDITGCVFDGKLLTTNGSTCCGGFVGWNGGTTSITNSLYAPAELKDGETWVGNDYSSPFARNGATITNCYYTSDFNDGTNYTGQGTFAIAVDKSSSETVTPDYSVSSIKLHDGYMERGDIYYVPALSETGSVTDAIANKFVAYKRSFTAGKAATICLPFNFTPDDKVGQFYVFDGITKENGQYIATMKENAVKALTANTPYVFNPTQDGELVFSGIADKTISAGETTSDDWTFLGTYDEVKWDEAPTGIYGFSAQAVDDQGISQGEFVKVGAKVKIRPFRAYLKYKDGSENYSGARAFTRSDADELPASIMVRFIDSKGNTTAIGTVDTQTGEVNIDREGWYTLSGRRLPNKPTQRGIYINNGNKVLIK